MKRLAYLHKSCLRTPYAFLSSLRLSESFPGQEPLDGSSENSPPPAKGIHFVDLFSVLLSSGRYQPLRQTPLMILERLDTVRRKGLLPLPAKGLFSASGLLVPGNLRGQLGDVFGSLCVLKHREGKRKCFSNPKNRQGDKLI
jgi:hypothetical protein